MPTSREVQMRRRAAIREILMELEIKNQQELLEELARRGMKATQSSISRDLHELGAARINGFYGFPRNPRGAEEEFTRVIAFVRQATSVGTCMTLLKTDANAGPLVARAIDAGDWQEVAGTVAGPDSVLVLTDDLVDDQAKFWERLDRLLGFEASDIVFPDDPGPRLSRPRRWTTLFPRR